MLGHTNRRRSRRFLATTLLALVAQGLLVMVSPLADVHYHEHGPLALTPAGHHHLTQRAGECPECLAMQTLAVPGTPTYTLGWNWAREEAPTPTRVASHPTVRATSTFARAPPALPGVTLQTL